MKINYYRYGYDTKALESYITKAYECAIDYLHLPCKDIEVNVSFVSRYKIKDINREHRGKDSVTDVLSFPTLLNPNETDMHLVTDKLTKDNFRFDINPDTNNIVIGDICICLFRAKQQAKEYGNSIEREVTYLAVHGLLHLLGYDHMIDSDKVIMRKAEEDIMTRINLERD